MLHAPDIADSAIAACLRTNYDLRVVDLAFLPLGADVDSAVYRVQAKYERTYFLKLRREASVPASVLIPAWLSQAGMRWVVAPIRTQGGALGARMDGFALVLYPFVRGRSGWEIELTPLQWSALGHALASLHTIRLPPELMEIVARESCSSAYRTQARRFVACADRVFEDPYAGRLAAVLAERRRDIEYILGRAHQGAEALARRRLDVCLCHGDIHAGNVLVDERGRLYLIDWDTLVLAPKERDLMFVGGGVGGNWNRADEAHWFYRGYGPATVDAEALTFYRHERIVRDVAEICGALFGDGLEGADRAEMLGQFEDQFRPGNVVQQAYAADRRRCRC